MIVMIYNKQVCKEFLLPNIHNADYSLILYREIFRLAKDVELMLENSAKGWELLSGKGYRIRKNRQEEKRQLLRDKDIIELRTAAGEQLQVIVIEAGQGFPATKKYNIGMMKEISVGKSEGNLICYSFMDLVSASHAAFVHHSDGWYLTDTSSNGVFCENMRIQGKRKLRFGDHIELFGLHLIFLNDMLAVGTFYGNLRVNESILQAVELPLERGQSGQGAGEPETAWFHRSPRNLPEISRETVEIEAPPNPRVQKPKPVYLTIGPAFTMAIPMMLGCGFSIFGARLGGNVSGAFMYTGLITAVSSAIIGVIWAIANLNYSKKEALEDENQRFNAYSNYLVRIAEDLREKYRQNTEALRKMYPPAKECIRYNRNSSELWNRNQAHGDFLYQRFGIGELPFQVKIEIPKEKFTLLNDTLAEKPAAIKKEFQTLHQVPVGIPLSELPLVGLVGGTGKSGAVALMHSIVAGITAAHSYTDVKLVFIYRETDRNRQADWECMRWFPHVWSEDKSTRYMAANELETGDIFFELANILRRRSQTQNAQGDGRTAAAKPYYVLFISDPAILEGEILAKYIYEKKPEYGMTTFLMAENLEQLPNLCEDIIENSGRFCGMYNLLDTDVGRKAFVPDTVRREDLEAFGKVLANIRVNETESSSEVPVSLSFMEMYGAASLPELNVEERWRKNRNYNSMKVLIGRKAGDADCFLDVHEKFHGPHGLVAGTTGSGKSELLQTYILSLAVQFSPEDVSFFIIDFKGGGMANLFSELPHLCGQISNLSGNQVRRAMISIKSENQRRQRVFAEYGVNNINSYTRLYKNQETELPIPHLFIIIDEFAELKREEPDFMRELISVAQVGRSLGVHLILATQKPSGTVDDNIWSNSRFRLCLRVQDRQDSSDMLHKPDAAFITQAGRGYLQVGNDEIYEMFQSGYSGAPYQEDAQSQGASAALLTRTGRSELSGGHRIRRTEQTGKEKTQLEAVIQHLKEVAGKNGYQKAMQLWLPVLGEKLYLQELEGSVKWQCTDYACPPEAEKWKLEAQIGLYDDPSRQLQEPLKISFSEGGHHAVCGSTASGKSTFLQTLVYSLINRYSPDWLQLYLLDFSSHMLAPFEKAPHVGGVVYDNQEDRLAKFMHMLDAMMEERKRLFSGGNYGQYVRAYGVRLPAVLVVVDNLSAFREKTKNGYDELLFRLTREGVSYGIYLAVTAAGFGMSEIPSRMGDNIRTVISLEQADKFKYMEVLRAARLSILPETGVRGRGLAYVDGRILEFQTALSVEAEDDFARGQKIEDFCQELRSYWKGTPAAPIPEIPEKPDLAVIRADARYQEAIERKGLLPLGYRMEDASIYSLVLEQIYCYVISGRGRTGKTNVLKLLLYAAHEKGGELCVIEGKANELKKQAESCQAEYVEDSKELFQYLQKLLPEFSRRNRKKREMLDEGMEETGIFEKMSQEPPVFLFLSDLAEFFEMVYRPDVGVGQMSGFVENILEKGSLHNIYFFGCLNVEDQAVLPTYRAYQYYISYKKGIHLGGNLAGQKIFSFQNLSYAQQSKTMKKGLGYVPDNEEESIGVEVVVPMARI